MNVFFWILLVVAVLLILSSLVTGIIRITVQPSKCQLPIPEPVVCLITGPTGAATMMGVTGNTGPQGDTGPSGFYVPPTQFVTLTDAVIQTIETTVTGYRLGLFIQNDQRSNFGVPDSLIGNQNGHVDIWDPFAETWYDQGPWLGFTGFKGATGISSQQTGPTGATGLNVTGATGSQGLTGDTGPAGVYSVVETGSAYGSGSDGDFTVPLVFTMTRDYFFRNLILPNQHIIFSRGFRIFCSETFSNRGGFIVNSGSPGANARPLAFVGEVNTGGEGGATGVLGGGATGGYGQGPFIPSLDGQNATGAIFLNANNINAVYTGPGLIQNQLYGGGNASTTFPSSCNTGGGGPGLAFGIQNENVSMLLNALTWPVLYNNDVAGVMNLSPLNSFCYAAGGGAGYSNNPNVLAAGGGGGGGMIVLACARMDTTIPETFTGGIFADGGDAGANSGIQDVSGGGGGGGVIVIQTTTPYSLWPNKILSVKGGKPQNLNHGPGSPQNQLIAYGQPGQIFILAPP